MEFNLSLYWSKSTEKDTLTVVGVLGSSDKDIKFMPLSFNPIMGNGIKGFIETAKLTIKTPQSFHRYLEEHSNWMSYGVGKQFKVKASSLDNAIKAGIRMYQDGEIQ